MPPNQDKQNQMSTTTGVVSTHSVTSPQGDPRAARLRENKRRSRARQKEYVEDLEKRCRETEQRQVAATIEVQVAARKVAEENRRLRELLRRVGVPEGIVEGWLLGEEVDLYAGSPQALCAGMQGGNMDCPEGNGSCVAATQQVVAQSECNLEASESAGDCTNGEPAPPALSGGFVGPVERTCQRDTGNCQDSQITHLFPSSSSTTTFPAPPSPLPIPTTPATTSPPPPPCKVFSTLSLDPAIDHHTVPAYSDTRGEGVQCSQAYRMLIPYATTEQKMDELAARLGEGCVADGKGGCSVRTEVVWRALDDVCLD